MGLNEVGHLADLVARFAEKTLPPRGKA
jgi:hypothetical protein